MHAFCGDMKSDLVLLLTGRVLSGLFSQAAAGQSPWYYHETVKGSVREHAPTKRDLELLSPTRLGFSPLVLSRLKDRIPFRMDPAPNSSLKSHQTGLSRSTTAGPPRTGRRPAAMIPRSFPWRG